MTEDTILRHIDNRVAELDDAITAAFDAKGEYLQEPQFVDNWVGAREELLSLQRKIFGDIDPDTGVKTVDKK